MMPQRIAAIGTSTFFGTGDPSHGGYIGRLKVWHESYEKNELYNLGISGKTGGQTTSEILQRIIPEGSIREPDLVLLTSGINDIRRSGSKDSPPAVSLDVFKKNIHLMINQGQTLAEVIFVSVVPIKDKHDRRDNYLLSNDLDAYEAITRKVCQEENVAYVDIYNEWKKDDYFPFLTSDGVHPNEKGHEKIFLQLREFLLVRYQ